ncbi:MAG: OB-fold nucleic acid binding domain-containing protein, partial [Geobacteraceae bacterium]
MTTIRLDDENRLSIPAGLLDRLGLKPGSRMNVTMDDDGRLMLTPLQESPATSSALADSIVRKNLETTVQFIRGVGPRLAEALAKKGIVTVEDALYLLPNRYEDRRVLQRVAGLKPGSTEVFHAEVLSSDVVPTRGGRRFFEVVVGDGSGTITLKWFNYNVGFMKKTWQQGRLGIFTGEVRQYGYQKEVHHPDVEWLAAGEDLAGVMARDPFNFGRVVPVYPLTEGLHQKTMRKVMKEIVDGFIKGIASSVPDTVADRHNLIPLGKALQEVHFPGNDADLVALNEGNTPAHRTLVFDELFFLELGLALRRQGVTLEPGISFVVAHRYTKPLARILPFQLTSAQRRVLTEIKNDMMAPHPMHRLVQGDV